MFGLVVVCSGVTLGTVKVSVVVSGRIFVLESIVVVVVSDSVVRIVSLRIMLFAVVVVVA